MQEVCTQIWATLYDYPSLKVINNFLLISLYLIILTTLSLSSQSCDGLIAYIKECVRTAWGLTNQVLSILTNQELVCQDSLGTDQSGTVYVGLI